MNSVFENSILFKSKNNDVRFIDFINAYKNLGIKKGDSLFVHTQLFAFGKLNKELRLSNEDFLNAILDSFKTSIGTEGTLLMTTFSQKSIKSKEFDIDKTPSEGGILTEFFRKQKDITRSAHPIQSFAAWGNKKHVYLDIDDSSFGDDSVYGKLYKNNATILFWGADFHYCTFNHFIEEKAKVPYRKQKKITIKVNNNENIYNKDVTTYYKSDRFRIDFSLFQKQLIQKGLLRSVKLGDGYISSIQAKPLFEEGIKYLKKNKWFFLKIEPLSKYWFRKSKAFIKNTVKRFI